MYLPRLAYNGPAIKAVSVAERMKAGAVSPHRVRVPLPVVMSEAWRGFCRHGTIKFGCWHDRGTKLLSGRKLVTVQEFGK